MKASSPVARSDASYAGALVAALLHAHPRLTRAGLAALLGIHRRHLRKLEHMQKELTLPMQLWMESKLDPAVVRGLRARLPPSPPPFWLARTEGNRHG